MEPNITTNSDNNDNDETQESPPIEETTKVDTTNAAEIEASLSTSAKSNETDNNVPSSHQEALPNKSTVMTTTTTQQQQKSNSQIDTKNTANIDTISNDTAAPSPPSPPSPQSTGSRTEQQQPGTSIGHSQQVQNSSRQSQPIPAEETTYATPEPAPKPAILLDYHCQIRAHVPHQNKEVARKFKGLVMRGNIVNGGVKNIDWTNDGKILATCSSDQTVKIYSLQANSESNDNNDKKQLIELHEIKPCGAVCSDVSWNASGNTLAIVCYDAKIYLYSIKFINGTSNNCQSSLITTIAGYSRNVVCFHPNIDNILALGKSFHRIDVANCSTERSYEIDINDLGSSIAWSHDGTKCAFGFHDNEVHVICSDDTTNNKLSGNYTSSTRINLPGSPKKAWSMDWSHNRLAIAGYFGDVQVWLIKSPNLTYLVQKFESNAAMVSWSNNGCRLVLGRAGGDIEIWHTATDRDTILLRTIKRERATNIPMTCLKWVPNENRIIVGSEDGTLDIWNLSGSGQAEIEDLYEVVEGTTNKRGKVAYPMVLTNANLIPIKLAVARKPDIHLYQIMNGKAEHRAKLQNIRAAALSFSRDGRLLAIGLSSDNKPLKTGIKIIDIGTSMGSMDIPKPGTIHNLAFSKTNDCLISLMNILKFKSKISNKKIFLDFISSASGKKVASASLVIETKNEKENVYSQFSWSPTTNIVASGTEAFLKLWSVTQENGMKEVCHFENSLGGRIQRLDWTSDGICLAGGMTNGSVVIWTVSKEGSAQLQTQVTVHEMSISSLYWFGDSTILSISGDKTMKFTRVESNYNDAYVVRSHALDKEVRSELLVGAHYSSGFIVRSLSDGTFKIMTMACKAQSLLLEMPMPNVFWQLYAKECLQRASQNDLTYHYDWENSPIGRATIKYPGVVLESYEQNLAENPIHFLPEVILQNEHSLLTFLFSLAHNETKFCHLSPEMLGLAMLDRTTFSKSPKEPQCAITLALKSAICFKIVMDSIIACFDGETMTKHTISHGIYTADLLSINELLKGLENFPETVFAFLESLQLVKAYGVVKGGLRRFELNTERLIRTSRERTPIDFWKTTIVLNKSDEQVDQTTSEQETGILVDAYLLPIKGLPSQGSMFLTSILEASGRVRNLKVMELPVIETLIDFKWKSIIRQRFLVDSVLFFLYALAFSAMMLNYVDKQQTLLIVFAILALLLWSNFVDRLGKIDQFWKMMNILTAIVNFVTIVLVFTSMLFHDNSSAEEAIHRSILYFGSCGLPLTWISLLYYTQGFQQSGHLMRIILEIFVALRFFLIILFAILIGFSLALYVLYKSGDPTIEVFELSNGDNNVNVDGDLVGIDEIYGWTTWPVSLVSGFALMVGEFDLQFFQTSVSPVLTTILFVLFVAIVNIVLLNVLIAILSDVYDGIQRNAKAQYLFMKVKIILEYETIEKKSFDRAFISNLQRYIFPSPKNNALHERDEWIQILTPQRLESANLNEGQEEWVGRVKAIENAIFNSERRLKKEFDAEVKELRLELQQTKQEIQLSMKTIIELLEKQKNS